MNLALMGLISMSLFSWRNMNTKKTWRPEGVLPMARMRGSSGWGVSHDSRCVQEDSFNVCFGNTVLATLGPIPLIPIKTSHFHGSIIHKCVYK
jgi:hypothetical protein